MTEDARLRERVATLENEFKHIDEKLDTMTAKLDEMHEAFTEGKGGWKVILGFAGFIGFLGGIAAWLVPWWFAR
jgi:hypothetical protein